MFKKFLGLDSTPSTPRIGRIELPDVGGEDAGVCEGPSSPRSPLSPWRRASTPQPDNLRPWHRSSTPQPTSPSPVCGVPTSRSDSLKATRRFSAPKVERKLSQSSRSSTPQPGSSRATERASSPDVAKPPLKGILKRPPLPQPVTLHWQLLPHDPSRSKKLIYFDVAQDVSFIRDHSNMPPLALKASDMEKPAAEIPLNEMSIRCTQLPHWDIHVSRSGPSGVRCLDVYRAIFETFHPPLTDAERELYLPAERRTRCEEQFRKRCKASPGLYDYELRLGMRRVDLLEGRTIFMGLRRPMDTDDKPDRYWVLELGLPKASRRGRG
ncbi:hypothetical protein AcW1_007643 [Taiwanofungus camphoratus]|nr:hypothetical protein AcV7_009846 [Antrodia cinnamomea]KAI0953419.1 hypothetical protein AcW1_007643 [Antrodia cinnamomea]